MRLLQLFILQLIVCANFLWTAESNAVYFQPGKEYRFSYRGTSSLEGVGTFGVDAKIGIIQLGIENNGTQHCLLLLHHYHVRVQKDPDTDKEAYMGKVNFTKWMSFNMDMHGHIDAVFYDPANDDLYAVEAKKKILGVLSNKLMISEQAESNGSRWAYTATEFGQEGQHETAYQAEPAIDSRNIIFQKKKKSKTVDTMDQSYDKVVHLDRNSNIPRHSEISEEFATSQRPSYTSTIRGSKDDIDAMDSEYGFPVMKGQGKVSLTFEQEVVNDGSQAVWHNRPQNLFIDTLQARQVPEDEYERSVAEEYIASNVTCMLRGRTTGDQETKMPCFRQLCLVMSRTSFQDLQTIVSTYRDSNDTVWEYIIDAVGATQSNDSLVLLTRVVLSSDDESFNVTMAALAHVIALEKCPPKDLTRTMLSRVFHKPWRFEDEHKTQLVNDRALLVLGGIANTMRKCNITWADDVTARLQEMTGVHDPHSHRVSRSVMSSGEFKRHVAKKSLLLMALSNDGHPSSYDYFMSYVNDTTSHIQLRCNAIHGINVYHSLQAAETLLHVALTDGDESVRYRAADAYTTHPHGGDIRNFLSTQDYKYSNVTDVEHVRMRRSLQDIASRIWKGFQFRLATPSFDWQKSVGGTQLGASMGVIVNNFLNIDIGPLSGMAEVNVYDKAWVTAHLGIIGIHYHFFLADICYKGSIGYDLNALAEYKFEEAFRLAELMDRVINGVVNRVKRSVRNFKNLLTTIRGFDISDIIDDFIDAIKQLPQNVFDLKKIARRLNKAMDEFTALPPVFYKIRDFVRKVKTIFNDVRTDIMKLYNAIVDTVQTTLPWAWREIKSAFNGMVDALRNILRNPMTSIQNLGRGVARISIAVGVVLDAKDVILEANIFAKENRPYWFDFTAVFEDLWDDVQDIVDALRDAYDWLRGEGGTDTGVALAYTGVTPAKMKEQVLAELWAHVMEEMMEPFRHLQRILEPFVQTYQFITDTIKSVKEAWTFLVESYNEARTLFESVFGAKFHAEFPRKYLKSTVCGDGFWESTGRDHYEHPGIDLVVEIDEPVVAPFGGEIRSSGHNQITIKMETMKDLEIIIDNVQMADTNFKEIGAGENIGIATRPWCSEGHVHVAMRNTNTSSYVDPARYKLKRKMPPPRWIEECDHYKLVWRDRVIQDGSITADPATEDETPALENAPSASELEQEGFTESTPTRRKRSISEWFDRFQNFTSSLGFGAINDLRELFSLRLNNITISRLLGFLRQAGYTELEATLTNVFEKVQELGQQESCARPESLDDDELRATMLRRGLSISGSRTQLERRYRHPDTECFGLSNHVSENTICTFEENCLGISCCVDFTLFDLYRHSVQAYAKYDPCDSSLALGVDAWSLVIPVPSLDDFQDIQNASLLEVRVGDLNVIQLLVHYQISFRDSKFHIDMTLAMCSSLREECMDILAITEGLEIPDIPCTATADRATRSTHSGLTMDTSMTVSELIDLLDIAGLSEEEIVEIIDEIREAFVLWLEEQIQAAVTRVFDNVLDHSDMCMRGYQLTFGPTEVEIYRSPDIVIPLGWFDLVFRFGLSGYYGARFHCTLCIMSMKAGATITPFVGAIAWGSLGLRIGPFIIGLRLTGYLLTTEFPTRADVYFQKFPIDVKARMDLKLTPLRVTLHGEIIFEFRISIWGARITIRKTLISVKLWEYRSRTINKNIFNVNDAEPDDSPPTFLPFDSVVGTGGNSKRALPGHMTCNVEQIVGKDYTEPAFNVQYDVADDRSDVETTLCIGTYRGGCDVLKDEPLTGTASLQSRQLYSGVPLHFTVTSRNTQGVGASIACDIPTYDVTLPTGRVTAEFTSTSHPHILRCLLFVTDDSEIRRQHVSAGYGDTSFGSQLILWESFQTARDRRTGTHSNNPAGTHYLTYYAVPQTGRLVYPPFSRTQFPYAARCAEECQRHPVTKCLGFNYDYGSSGACELLNTVEGHAVVQRSGNFHYFERLGVGHTGQIDRNNMNLVHNSLVYCNVRVENVLGYENFMVSEGIVVDFTPPDPGPEITIAFETMLIEDCTEYTPNHLDHRCAEQTPLPNYRFMTDVAYTECTVCNGHESGEDMLYTRANRMISCHWDHIHDNETGILIYTWAAGTEPCEDNIHPHRDPHAHIHQESEWTHQGVGFPLDLQDGVYHITITALNEVDFGGPMALRICHATPYIIDNTPPVIFYVDQAEYDETTYDITMNVTAGDDLSGLQYQQIGLGRTRRDTYISLFTNVPELNPTVFTFQIPDGIPVWVKVRIANNVDLRSVSHSPRALFIDSSPPLAGRLYMGRMRRVHERYQYQTTELCVNWDDFYDPQSGISIFRLGFGSSPGTMDIMEYIDLPHTEYQYCQDGLSLRHNTNYYATFVAFNGASYPRNVTSVSSAILVDTTAPHRGNVKDGRPEIEDIQYSSNAATVSVTWSDFYDSESGLADTKVSFIKHGDDQDTILHVQDNVPTSATTLQFHHFHLHHRDVIYTEVNVTNGAGLSTVNASDGFLVDLTDPVMDSLVDGNDPTNDIEFSSSSTSVTASWSFSDPDSGIAAYRTAVFTIASGLRHQIYPEGPDSWVTLDPEATGWTTGDILTLNPGHLYFTRVTAINGAGLTAVHDTNGFIIDPTPPQMTYVRAGVLAGESEEAIDGYVYQNNPHGIRASWKALDPESGIRSYLVGVGTAPGQDDVRTFTEVFDEDSYLDGLALELTDTTLNSPSPLYHITVKALSGAGQYSDSMTSSPIIVVEEDREGVVWDGTGASVSDDIDYQLNTRSLSITFSGFESALHGIDRYEWAIGTRPRYDDVMPFTDYGIIVTNENILGLGSEGFAKIIQPLEPGQKYFATVRAVTGAGNVLDVSTDGVTIDTSPATPTIVIMRGNAEASGEERVYQTEGTLEAEWSSSDEEGRVVNTWLSMGTVPGADDIYEKRPTTQRHLPEDVTPATGGQPNYITITVENSVGLLSMATSAPVILDNTAPSEGRVECPVFATGSTIKCSLWDFIDNESGMARFEVALGVSEGDSSISDFAAISAGADEFSIAFESLENFGENQEYYVTVKAVNHAELSTIVFSEAVFIDNTPPTADYVIEVLDHESFDIQSLSHVSPDTVINSMTDAVCQRDVTRVHIAWGEFVDDETGIDHYDIALGTAPGGTQVAGFMTLGASHTEHVFNNLDLARVRTVYATVRGYNKAGLHTTVVSNGVHISKLSAGLQPLQPLLIYDGPDESDLDFQNNIDGIGATWFLSGDPCPMREMRWTVMRFDNTVINPEEDLPNDQPYAFVDEIPIHDRESFYVKVTAVNELNYTVHLHSDGVTIKLEPVLPGTVRDGVIFGIDLSYQTSNSTLGCHWNGFGGNREDGTFDSIVQDTVGETDIEVGEHQEIDHYEVAIGTDRTTHRSRTDIRPFTNVYRNESWVFQNLNLESGTSIYYCTVRAYSISTARTEVTSNGIRIGHGGVVVQHGTITLDNYISSTQSMQLSWSGFEFTKPILRYYWGIANGNQTTEQYDCNNMVLNWRESETVADAHPLQDAALDSYVTPEDLRLVQGSLYTVLVVAVDESGTCDLASKAFTVDITPPTEGTILLENNVDLDVLYNDQLDTLHVRWEDFTDPESGLESFNISLYSARSCSPDLTVSGSLDLILQDILPVNSTSYTFMELDMQYNIPYYILLSVQNGAELATTVLSKPILVDITNPVAGKVMDGLDHLSDVEFQSSTSNVSGSFLYVPSNDVTCSEIVHSSFTENSAFSNIIHKGMWLVPEGKQTNVHFMNSQVIYSLDSLTLNMERKLSEEVVKSGAVVLETDGISSGMYQFELMVAEEDWATTSIAFWDGPPGIVYASSNITSEGTEVGNDRGITIVQQPFNSDTYQEGYRLTSVNGHGFGCKIRVIDDDGSHKTEVTLWGMTEGELRQSSVLLDMDGSEQLHTYDLSLNEDRDVDDIRDWDMKLYVDGVLKLALAGIEGVFPNGSVILALFNNDGFIPAVIDEFNPPDAETVIHSIVLPPLDDITCSPFKGGDHPIAEFYAGIGTQPGETDIEPFQRVLLPSIPCGNMCDDSFCDPHTNDDEVQRLDFTISGLDLTPSSDDVIGEDESASLQQAYFLTVKGLTGSGREAIASSNGFYIDTTPPVIHSILHFDTSYDANEPVRFQGNNYSIRVVWSAEDTTSDVIENWWAIGTEEYSTDIQDFVSVGKDQLAFNNNLGHLLQDGTTYCVTVKSQNAAGLVSYNSSEGVTVDLHTPDVANTSTELPGTVPIGSGETNAVSQSSQTNFTIQYGTPPPSENIVNIQIRAGTSPGQSDLFPAEQVGYNSTGQISITGNGLSVNNGNYQNLNASRGRNSMNSGNNADGSRTDTRKKRSTDEYTQLNVEPGRTVVMTVEMCNAAHLCSGIPTKDIVVMRDSDETTATDDTGHLNAHVEAPMFSDAQSTEFNISSQLSQTSDTYLITGFLSESDLNADYKSDASDSFRPMIVNPVDTMDQTDRNLRGRIQAISSTALFITALPSEPVAGPITVSFNFDRTQYLAESSTEPRLLGYCPTQGLWVDAGESCPDSGGSQVIWEESRVEVNVCNLTAYCEQTASGQRRVKRQAEDNNASFTGSNSFTVGAVDTDYVNMPPILTSYPYIDITEDEGIVLVQLTAADPELDSFEFLVSDTSESRGHVSLTTDGELTYRPCDDCFGQDTIDIIIREVRNDAIDTAESYATINITINPVNDSPRLLVVKKGESLSDEDSHVFLFIEEYADGNEDFYTPLEILIAAYDVDEDGINIVFGTVNRGDILVQNQVESRENEAQNCSLPWQQRRDAWREFEEEVRHGDDITVLIPCNMTEDVSDKALKWTLSLIQYAPEVEFHGEDNFRVNSRDDSESRLPSEYMDVTVYVMANPCLNGATCAGPETDPDCTSLERLNGFDGYRCRCLEGFEGEHCGTNTDDCQPNKCKAGYKCIDKVAGYDCECVEGPCLLQGWMIGLIVVTCIAVVATVIALVVCGVCVRKKQSGSDKKRLLEESQAEITILEPENTYEIEDIQYLPDSTAPNATPMMYYDHHKQEPGASEPLPWAKRLPTTSSEKSNRYELQEVGPTLWNNGFQMPKQPIHAPLIKVKSEQLNADEPHATNKSTIQYPFGKSYQEDDTDDDTREPPCHEERTGKEDSPAEESVATTIHGTAFHNGIREVAYPESARAEDIYDVCNPGEDIEEEGSQDESDVGEDIEDGDSQDESSHDEDVEDEETHGNDGHNANMDNDDLHGDNLGDNGRKKTPSKPVKEKGVGGVLRKHVTHRAAVVPLITEDGKTNKTHSNEKDRLPKVKPLDHLKETYAVGNASKSAPRAKKATASHSPKVTKQKQNNRPKTANERTPKPYVSKNPRPKTSPGPRSAWKNVWKGVQVDHTDAARGKAKKQLAWKAAHDATAHAQKETTAVQVLKLDDEKEMKEAMPDEELLFEHDSDDDNMETSA